MDDYLASVRAFHERTLDLLMRDPAELRELLPNPALVAARLFEVQEGVRLLRVALGEEPLRGEIKASLSIEDTRGKKA